MVQLAQQSNIGMAEREQSKYIMSVTQQKGRRGGKNKRSVLKQEERQLPSSKSSFARG